jgi:hypothetical protein
MRTTPPAIPPWCWQDNLMAIAREKRDDQDTQQERQPPPLRMVFFEERTASFFEMAVDHLLGFKLITEREHAQVNVFYVDDLELRAALLEAARRMGGQEVPIAGSNLARLALEAQAPLSKDDIDAKRRPSG